MPERRLFPERRDELQVTRYPFADTASLTSQQDDTIPKGTFLDAAIYPIGAAARMYISQIAVTSSLITFSISDSANNALATGSFNPLLRITGLVKLLDGYGRQAGVLVSDPDRLAVFGSWAVGVHTFQLGATEFVASCCIPLPEIGVRGILLEDGTLLTGDVWLVGRNGVVLTRDPANGTIRIDIVGDPLFLRNTCFPLDLFTTTNFLRTINGCPPDEFGNFNLTVGDHEASDTILRIYPFNGGLKIEAVGQSTQG